MNDAWTSRVQHYVTMSMMRRDNWTDVSGWHSTLPALTTTPCYILPAFSDDRTDDVRVAPRRARRVGGLCLTRSDLCSAIEQKDGPWHELWQRRSTVNASINDLPSGSRIPSGNNLGKGANEGA